MANQKRFVIGDQTGGIDPNICIQQDATDLFWDGGAFVVSQTLIPMVEKFTGFFEYETDSAVFPNGTYNIVIFADSSSAAVVLLGFSQRIVSDTQMDSTALVSLSARNAVASVSAALSKILVSQDATTSRLSILEGKVDSYAIALTRRS